MKNLHFYIQCIMVLIALGFAVQIPLDSNFFRYVVLIEFLLGVYQMGMSLMLANKLRRGSALLDIHLFGSMLYLVVLALLGILSPSWMEDIWPIVLFVFPWAIAILFLVTIDDLERKRHYKL